MIIMKIMFQLTNEVRQALHTKLAKTCGDTLFCDISDMEAVCSDILDSSYNKRSDILREKRQTRKRNRNKYQRRIKILFKMLGKTWTTSK